MKPQTWLPVVLVAALTTVSHAAMSDMSPAVSASNETLSKLSTQVTVPSAYSEGPGWMVIHASDAKGGVAAVIGYAPLKDGLTKNILVTLSRPAVNGETLYAMLHADKGVVGTYEFPGPDVPVMDGKAQMVNVPFKVEVAAGVPAVRLTLSEQGEKDYLVTKVQPESYAGMIVAGPKENPTLKLRPGWRYEVDNPDGATHPFQLIESGKDGSADVVLLSEAGMGTLQSDATVGWYNQNGEVRFTVSDDLAKVLSGYRCGYHTDAMRGSVNVM
jgi:hypothetical protein